MPDLLSRLFVKKAEDELEQLLIKQNDTGNKEQKGQQSSA